MKNVDTVSKDGLVVVLMSVEDAECPVCGEKMEINTTDDVGICLSCEPCGLLRWFEFSKERYEENYHPVIQLINSKDVLHIQSQDPLAAG